MQRLGREMRMFSAKLPGQCTRRGACLLHDRSASHWRQHAPSHRQHSWHSHAFASSVLQGSWSSAVLALFAFSATVETIPAAHSSQLAPSEQKEGSNSSKGSWMGIFKVKKSGQAATALPAEALPQTIDDLTDIVAANCPVFYFYHDEQYFPCTVEFFLERCQLLRVARGWKRRVLDVLVDYGMLDAAVLAKQQEEFTENKSKRKGPRSFLQLKLQRDARGGQPEDLNKIPIYATVKETLDPLLGRRDGIEINYMKFLAFNGPYKLFHSIWVGPLGAHDADWEHVTVRLTPDGKEVTGVYYSAHRHRDGLWRSADEVPRSADGRPVAYIAENGHGSYPVAGTIWRLFCVINDYTSKGKCWDPEKVVLVTQSEGDKIPSVVSRGSSLNGTSYQSPCSTQNGKPAAHHAKVDRQDPAWLKYEGKWGGTVEAPQKQEWYIRAENPVSRTWLQQIFFPLLPGVQTIWEPAVEEAEEALEGLRQGMDEGMEAFKNTTEEVQKEFEQSRVKAYRRFKELVKEIRKRMPDDNDKP